jgi:hypothetical protein
MYLLIASTRIIVNLRAISAADTQYGLDSVGLCESVEDSCTVYDSFVGNCEEYCATCLGWRRGEERGAPAANAGVGCDIQEERPWSSGMVCTCAL